MTVYTRSELIVLLRENALIKSGEAWSRIDGGQDLCIGAMLADQSADAIAEMQSELAATKAALAESEKREFALAADQCHAGYSGEHGHHSCKEVDAWKARAEAAEARVAKLEAALTPFAEYAADPGKNVPGELVITVGSNMAKRQLRMRDCYAARAALVQEAGK